MEGGDEGMMMTTTMNMDEIIDWERILEENDIPVVDDLGLDATFFDQAEQPSPASDQWINEIEELLMSDDADAGAGDVVDGVWAEGFSLSDILLDSPAASEEREREEEEKGSPASVSPPPEGVVVNADTPSPSTGGDSNNSKEKDDNANDAAAGVEVSDDSAGDDDDPLSKKRKRQLRNRDAAMRSRERKKVYVKDLEMKSRYLEGECRRLGRLLQCCYAENQMLRISLQSAMAKPESAVLLPESLLLGSLVWHMALICLFPLPQLPRFSRVAVALGSGDRSVQESAVPKGKGTKPVELRLPLSFLTSKRCRASRTRMKPDVDCALVVS